MQYTDQMFIEKLPKHYASDTLIMPSIFGYVWIYGISTGYKTNT